MATNSELHTKSNVTTNLQSTESIPSFIKSIRSVIEKDLIAFNNTKIPEDISHHQVEWTLTVNPTEYTSITYSSTSPAVSNASSCTVAFNDWEFSQQLWKNGEHLM